MVVQDICLRSKTPSFQQDADIDLDLPEMDPKDGAGLIYTIDGAARMNYFRMKVELAHIDGKVYDLLYSTRANKASQQERTQRVRHLEALLEQWRRKIPASLQTLVMVHGIYSLDPDWMQRISSYSRVVMIDCDVDGTGSCSSPRPPLPQGWTRSVETSRACMRLFSSMPQTENGSRVNACAFFSGLVVLLANMLVFPDHALLEMDRALADKGMQLFDLLLPLSEDDEFHRFHVLMIELRRRAFSAVDCAAKEREQPMATSMDAVSGAFGGTMADSFFLGADNEGPFGLADGGF